jgi:hypothetical protein
MNMTERVEEAVFFRFEEVFIDAGIRCIPMIVRFKLDAVGIKLKLAQWSRMTEEQRLHLAQAECESAEDLIRYRENLYRMVQMQSGETPTLMPVEENPSWSRKDEIPYTILERLNEHSASMQLLQWQALTDLQRFALLKLSYSGHENKNFPKALKEFRISNV